MAQSPFGFFVFIQKFRKTFFMRYQLLLLFLFSITICFSQNIGIGTTTPNASAMLDVQSTSKGLLMPRMTLAQRNLIASPATGLLVYQTDNTPGFYFYNGSGWVQISTGGATSYWSANGTHIFNNNAGNVGIGISSPLATLDVARGTAFNGTALLRGTTHSSSFNYGAAEDTYIRGGKSGSFVIINDETLGNVGIGNKTPTGTLDVARGSGPDGTALFRGTTHASSFNFGTTEHTYIRGGKNGSHVIINDITGGDVGIGTTNPQTKLHIHSTSETVRISGTNSFLSIYDNANNGIGFLLNNGGSIDVGTFSANTNGEVRLKTKGNLGLAVQSDGRVRVGNLGCNISVNSGLPKLSIQGALGFKKTNGDQVGEWAIDYTPISIGLEYLTFWYNGGIKASINDDDGDWITHSDFRLKENFEKYKPVLPGIKKLDVQTYHYIADKTDKRSFGLVAQNLKQYFPELVSGDDKVEGSYLGISYGKTGVLAIKAIQEQQVIIDTQQKKIDELEKRLSILEKKLR
jgi:Chaperone of endosialidase